jgi:ATP-dependent DNA helicase Rep
MKERVGQTWVARRRGADGLTFHTLGLEIIRREHKSLNLKPIFPCSTTPTSWRC